MIGRQSTLALVALLLGCSGSSQPARAPENLTIEDLEKQTEAACRQLQDCDLIDEGQEALDDCVARGLYTVGSGTQACVKTYWRFEACVAESGCGDLEDLFRSPAGAEECRELADAVQQKCNINVL